MLCQFTVKNYKSIRDEVTFDMQAAISEHTKFDKQYLEGKYGADPYLRRIIDWGKINV